MTVHKLPQWRMLRDEIRTPQIVPRLIIDVSRLNRHRYPDFGLRIYEKADDLPTWGPHKPLSRPSIGAETYTKRNLIDGRWTKAESAPGHVGLKPAARHGL